MLLKIYISFISICSCHLDHISAKKNLHCRCLVTQNPSIAHPTKGKVHFSSILVWFIDPLIHAWGQLMSNGFFLVKSLIVYHLILRLFYVQFMSLLCQHSLIMSIAPNMHQLYIMLWVFIKSLDFDECHFSTNNILLLQDQWRYQIGGRSSV